jgi:hypothetical protein
VSEDNGSGYASLGVAIHGRTGFKNQTLADKLAARFSPLVAEADADVLIVLWDGQPGPAKVKIAERTSAKRDVIAVKPDGTFTRMGFGNCLTTLTP